MNQMKSPVANSQATTHSSQRRVSPATILSSFFGYTLSAALIALGLAAMMCAQTSSQRPASTDGQQPQPKDYQLAGPYTYRNLSIFLILGPDKITGKQWLTLEEALAQKKVVVYETKDVNDLAIQNLSNQEVYVQSGEIVKGGQQDRMLGVDMIVPPHSGRIPIAAFCVESGRWSKRGGEQAGVFSSSSDAVATREIKLAAKVANDQGEVWKNVALAQDKLSENLGTRVNSSASESSLQLAVENSAVRESAENYIKALSQFAYSKRNVIGYAFAINGQVNSADVYASSALFHKLWPKLLRASAIEAISALQKNQDAPAVTAEKVQNFLAEPEAAKPTEKEVTGRTRLVTKETEENVYFETRDRAGKDEWVHRNYIKKN